MILKDAVATEPRLAPPVGFWSTTLTNSSWLSHGSARTGTWIEAAVCPEANDRVPEVGVKSRPGVAFTASVW